jgi:hypothetical protein
VIVLSDEFYREILDHPIPTSKRPRRFHPVLRPSICLCGSPIVVLPRGGGSAFHSSAISVLSANLGVRTMRALASFARNWRAGSISFVRCGRSVPRQLTRMAPDCLLIGRMPSFPEEPM